MMSLLSELSRRLEDDEEPLAKRLCLAQNAFVSPLLPASQKRDVIIDWLSQLLNTSNGKWVGKGTGPSDEHSSNIWFALQTCVKNSSSNRPRGADIRTNVKGSLIMALIKHLQRGTFGNADFVPLVDCIVSVLETSSFQQYLRDDLVQYMELVSALMSALKNIASDHPELCVRAVISIQEMCRWMVSKDEFAVSFLSSAACPLTALLVAEGGNQSTPLATEVYKCFQKALFPKGTSEMIKFLEDVFQEEKQECDPLAHLPLCEKKYPVPFKLLKTMRDLKDHLDSESFVCLCTILFKAFVASYKATCCPSVLQMFLTICCTAGLRVAAAKFKAAYKKLKEISSHQIVHPSETSLRVLHGLVNILGQWNVPLDTEISKTSLLQLLQMLMDASCALQSSIGAGQAFMRLVTSMINMSPLIVEGRSKALFVSITAKPFAAEDKGAYTDFICAVFSTFNKLQRAHVFFTDFLESLKGARVKKESDRSMWVPTELTDLISSSATLMPSASAIATLDALLSQLSHHCLEPLEQSSGKDKTSLDPALETCVFTVSELSCALLKGVRLLEQSATAQPRSGYCKVIELFRSSLRNMGQILLRLEYNATVTQSFLKLSYFWAAEILLVQYYAAVGGEELLTAFGCELGCGVKTSNQKDFLNYLHTYLSDVEWRMVISMVKTSGDKESEDILLKLNLQLLCALQVFEISSSSEAECVARQSLKGMVRRLSVEQRANALDHSTVSDIKLMTPFLDKDELMMLAESVIAYLLLCESEGEKEVIGLLCEQRSLMCALVCATLDSLKRILKISKRKRDEGTVKARSLAHNVIRMLDTSVLFNVEISSNSQEAKDAFDTMISGLAEPIQQSMGEGVDIHPRAIEANLVDVSRHLQLLRDLCLIYLSPSSQASVFLLLFSIAEDCFNMPQSTERDNILCTLFQHLMLGIAERGFHFVAKLGDHLDMGLLIQSLVSITTQDKRCRRLLELVVKHAAHTDKTLDQVLDKVELLRKKAAKRKLTTENLLLATLILQILLGIKLRADVKEVKERGEKIKDTKQLLAKNFCVALEKQTVDREFLHAFALTLDCNLRFSKAIDPLTPHLEKFCDIAFSELKADEGNHQAAEALISVVLVHHNVLREHLSNSLISNVWSVLVNASQRFSTLAKMLFEKATSEEMLVAFSENNSGMNEEVNNGDIQAVGAMRLCCTLLGFQHMESIKTDKLKKNICSVLKCLHTVDKLSHPQMLDFLYAVITAPKLTMDMEMVDDCFMALGIVSLEKINLPEYLSLGKKYKSVLAALVMYHPEQVHDSIPSFLQRLRILLKSLAGFSCQGVNLSRIDEAQLAELALGVEKLISNMTLSDKKMAFKRPAAFLIADILALFEEVTICSSVKVHFENMVYALVNIIDHHTTKFLLRLLSPASNEIFKTLQKSYRKFYRFTGKV